MLNQIEQRAGGVAQAIALLGVSQNRWYMWARGEVQMPLYIQRSIEAHLALSDKAFKQRIKATQ